MAKPPRGVKSQAIRDYLAAHPNAGPKEVVAALKEKGISVSSQMVSNLKANVGGGRKRRRRKQAAASSPMLIDTLVRAKGLAEEFGGVDKARAALAALARLQ